MSVRLLVLALCTGCAVQISTQSETAISFQDKIPDYLASLEIPSESHWVETDDGYILGAFRLANPGRPVLLLQHGILASAWCWLINDPELSPALRLYHLGYDVWLTNTRGNTFSRNHTKWNPDEDEEFWAFSFTDMGRYDVPSNIAYILKATGKTDLIFVGWSQGTSQFFVSMTDPKVREYVKSTVRLFVALSPVAFLANQKSNFFAALGNMHVADAVMAYHPYAFLDATETGAPLQRINEFFCRVTMGIMCKLTVDLFCGTSPEDEWGAITNMSAHFPAGTSVRSMLHYQQLYLSKRFAEFDFGAEKNLEVYGNETAPAMDLGQATVPTALFGAGHDLLSDLEDLSTLVTTIAPTEMLEFSNVWPQFSHATWFVGNPTAFQKWFPQLVRVLAKYTPAESQAQVAQASAGTYKSGLLRQAT